MWNYNKILEYPVNIKCPNPRLAKFVITQYGRTRWRTEFIAKWYKLVMVTICEH